MSSLGVQLQIDFDRFVLLESGPNGSPLTLALGHSDGVILVVTDRCQGWFGCEHTPTNYWTRPLTSLMHSTMFHSAIECFKFVIRIFTARQ